jgi:hypothetical protein
MIRPYKGTRYADSIFSLRLCYMGKCHYKTEEIYEAYTEEVGQAVADGRFNRDQTFWDRSCKLLRSAAGLPSSGLRTEIAETWASIAYSNYFQRGMARGEHYTAHDNRIAQAAFGVLIEELHPHLIVVGSITAWKAMPQPARVFRDWVRGYCLQDRSVVVAVGVRHVSLGWQASVRNVATALAMARVSARA